MGNLSFAMTPMNSGRLTGRLNIDKGFARYGMPPVLGEQTFRFVQATSMRSRVPVTDSPISKFTRRE